MTTLDAIAARGSDAIDLTDPAAQPRVRDLADELLAVDPDVGALRSLGRDRSTGIDVRVATKLAESKLALADVPPDAAPQVVVQFAMWGEHRRLRPRDGANPLGEDALRVKLDQLDWLLGDAFPWRLVAVDDGCPDDSASVAEQMAAQHRLRDRVQVLRLADALPARSGPLAGLSDTSGSRKGGAMVYGAQQALDAGADAVVYTDADSSVDLGQLGLLLAPFAGGRGDQGEGERQRAGRRGDQGEGERQRAGRRGYEVVIGDRKHPDAVLRKAEARWGPGIVVLRHMQRMVGRALFSRGLRDTQAAFKLYGRDALRDILAAPSTFGFAFDSDWLYAALAGGHDIATTPFAFVDSFEESASITQGPMTTWESLLTGLTAAARARHADHDEQMAAIVDDFAVAAMLERVVEQVPPQLDGVPPDDLGDPSVMSPDELRAWLEEVAGDLV